MAKIYFPLSEPEKLLFPQSFIEISGGTAFLKGSERTPPETGYIYPTNAQSVQLKNPFSVSELKTISADIETHGSDEIRFLVEIDGIKKYFNGFIWVNSTGTTETNSIEDVSENIGSLINTLSVVNLLIFFISFDGTSTPVLRGLEIDAGIINTGSINRNSFCSLIEAQKIIHAYIDSSESFFELEELEQEKYLINAFHVIHSLPYQVDLSLLHLHSETVKNAFIRAQCEQAVNLFLPSSAANELRNEGITELSLPDEKITVTEGLLYTLCPGARKFIGGYVDMEIKIL